MVDISLLGTLGGCCMVLSLLPQVINLVVTRSAGDLSVGFALLYLTGNALEFTYLALLGAFPMYLPDATEMGLALLVIALKLALDRGLISPPKQPPQQLQQPHHHALSEPGKPQPGELTLRPSAFFAPSDCSSAPSDAGSAAAAQAPCTCCAACGAPQAPESEATSRSSWSGWRSAVTSFVGTAVPGFTLSTAGGAAQLTRQPSQRASARLSGLGAAAAAAQHAGPVSSSLFTIPSGLPAQAELPGAA